MKEQIESIKQTAIEEIAKAEDLQTLENARRPIRPKPLMATFTDIIKFLL